MRYIIIGIHCSLVKLHSLNLVDCFGTRLSFFDADGTMNDLLDGIERITN